MAFLRVVEVLPLLFAAGQERIALDAPFDAFVEGVKEAARYSDLTLVASVKDPALVRFDPVHAAVMVHGWLHIDVAPVVVSRDQNRPESHNRYICA